MKKKQDSRGSVVEEVDGEGLAGGRLPYSPDDFYSHASFLPVGV